MGKLPSSEGEGEREGTREGGGGIDKAGRWKKVKEGIITCTVVYCSSPI